MRHINMLFLHSDKLYEIRLTNKNLMKKIYLKEHNCNFKKLDKLIHSIKLKYFLLEEYDYEYNEFKIPERSKNNYKDIKRFYAIEKRKNYSSFDILYSLNTNKFLWLGFIEKHKLYNIESSLKEKFNITCSHHVIPEQGLLGLGYFLKIDSYIVINTCTDQPYFLIVEKNCIINKIYVKNEDEIPEQIEGELSLKYNILKVLYFNDNFNDLFEKLNSDNIQCINVKTLIESEYSSDFEISQKHILVISSIIMCENISRHSVYILRGKVYKKHLFKLFLALILGFVFTIYSIDILFKISAFIGQSKIESSKINRLLEKKIALTKELESIQSTYNNNNVIGLIKEEKYKYTFFFLNKLQVLTEFRVENTWLNSVFIDHTSSYLSGVSLKKSNIFIYLNKLQDTDVFGNLMLNNITETENGYEFTYKTNSSDRGVR